MRKSGKSVTVAEVTDHFRKVRDGILRDLVIKLEVLSPARVESFCLSLDGIVGKSPRYGESLEDVLSDTGEDEPFSESWCKVVDEVVVCLTIRQVASALRKDTLLSVIAHVYAILGGYSRE